MATQSCESCKVQFASSLSHCPSCGAIGRNIARQVELLNYEIQILKSRIESYRIKKLPCRECNTQIAVNSIVNMHLEERVYKGGLSGTVDSGGRVNVSQDFIKDEKIGQATGFIALQIHDGGDIKVRWKKFRLKERPSSRARPPSH